MAWFEVFRFWAPTVHVKIYFSDEKPSFEVPLAAVNLAKAEPSRFNGLGQSWTSNQKEEDSMEVHLKFASY